MSALNTSKTDNPSLQRPVSGKSIRDLDPRGAFFERTAIGSACELQPLPPEEQERHLVIIHHSRAGIIDEIAAHPLALEAVNRLLERRSIEAFRTEVSTALQATQDLWKMRGAEGWNERYTAQLSKNQEVVRQVFKELPTLVANHFDFVFKIEGRIEAINKEAARLDNELRRGGAIAAGAIQVLEEGANLPLQKILESHHRIGLLEKIAQPSFDIMVRTNLRLVAVLAKGYSETAGAGSSVDDRFQRGTLGLMAALKRFDPGAGASLSTYAIPWIQQSIRRLMNEDVTIHVPVHEALAVKRFEQGRARCTQLLGDRPREEEVARHEQIELSKVWSARPRVVSLTAPAEGASGATTDFDVADRRDQKLHRGAEFLDSEKMIERLFDGDTQLIAVIKGRVYVVETGRKSLRDLARELNLTRERVRQLENEALGLMTDYLIVRSVTEGRRDAVASRALSLHERALIRNLFDDEFIPFDRQLFVDQNGEPLKVSHQQRALTVLATALVLDDLGVGSAERILAGLKEGQRSNLSPLQQSVVRIRLFDQAQTWQDTACVMTQLMIQEQRRAPAEIRLGSAAMASNPDELPKIVYLDDRVVQRQFRLACEKLSVTTRAVWRREHGSLA